MKIFNYIDPLETAVALSNRVATVLTQAIEDKGAAVLVVSGGSTPKPMFNHLSEQDLDWSKVTITLADERCVNPTDAASNALLVKNELLQNNANKAKFVSLFDGGELSLSHQEIANERMNTLPKFDVVILGMGDDGHTASIFPESENRTAALNLSNSQYALVTDPKTVKPMRITQTARRLLDSDLLVIHIAGSSKAELFNKISESPNEKNWPISAFVTQKTVPLEVYQSGYTSSNSNALDPIELTKETSL